MSKSILYPLILTALIIINVTNSFAETLLFDYKDEPTINISSEKSVKKKYPIKFNSDALNNNLKFKLPDGKIIKVRLENRKKSKLKGKFETTTYTGYLKGKSKSSGEFILSITTDSDGSHKINGRIRTKEGVLYHLGQEPDNTQTLKLIDEDNQLECAGEPHVDLPADIISPDSAPGIRADSTITLLIAYSPDAVSAVGSAATLEGIIAQMVSDANTAHANSHTGITYELAATYALSANSSNDFGTDLSNAASTDGKWDELQTLRQQYCADQVVVIVSGIGSQFCGIGYLMTSHSDVFSKEYMYSIVSSQINSCPFTMAHELAHNLGSAHDFENSGGGGGAYAYSYGYRFTGNDARQYRTVLAYSPGTRIGYFSNPSITYQGTATGTESANNALSVSQTGAIVSTYLGANGECSSQTPIPINTPTTSPGGGSPGSGITPGTPTTLPAVQPDTVTLSANTKDNQTTFKVKVTGGGTAVEDIPVSIYFDKTGLTGFTTLYASLTTNSRGIKKVVKKRKRGYYIACYSSLCSAAKKL